MTGQPDAGSLTVELVLSVPAIAILIWLLLWAGTAGQTPGEVSLAAADAARAAAATRDPAARPAQVERLVEERLASTCEHVEVTTTQLDRLIRVEVDCLVTTAPMRGLGIGSHTFAATGLATIDRFIAERPAP